MVLKRLKYHIFIIFMLFNSIVMSTTLQSIKYLGNTIQFEFDAKVPENIIKYNQKIPSIQFKFNNTNINKRNINTENDIYDQYLKLVSVDNYKNNTNVVIYLNKGTTYSSASKKGNLLLVNLKRDSKAKRPFTIVIDPGHGGKDSGARDSGYNEKDLALSVALKLYYMLKEEYQNVIITRNKDVFIPLNERAEIGNNANTDVFISIHLNRAKNRSASGTEAFYFSKNPDKYASEIAEFENNADKKGASAIENSAFIVQDVIYKLNQKQSAELAETAIENISKEIQIPKRKVLGANFAVLRGSKSPAILIELGFMSNKLDLSRYKDPKYQQKAADAILEAIKKHF